MKKTIYDLELFETIEIKTNMESSGLMVRRVPGGWIFTEWDNSINEQGVQNRLSSSFIPFNNEFEPKKELNMQEPFIIN